MSYIAKLWTFAEWKSSINLTASDKVLLMVLADKAHTKKGDSSNIHAVDSTVSRLAYECSLSNATIERCLANLGGHPQINTVRSHGRVLCQLRIPEQFTTMIDAINNRDPIPGESRDERIKREQALWEAALESAEGDPS